MSTKLFFVAPALAGALLCAACDNRPDQTASRNDMSGTSSSTYPPSTTTTTPGGTTTTTPSTTTPSTTTPSTTTPSTTTGADKYSASDLARGTVATQITNPQTTLANATVESRQGDPMGSIKGIVVGRDGKASSVNLEVAGVTGAGDQRVVSVEAEKFIYLPDRNVLVVQMTPSELSTMPTAPTLQ